MQAYRGEERCGAGSRNVIAPRIAVARRLWRRTGLWRPRAPHDAGLRGGPAGSAHRDRVQVSLRWRSKGLETYSPRVSRVTTRHKEVRKKGCYERISFKAW